MATPDGANHRATSPGSRHYRWAKRQPRLPDVQTTGASSSSNAVWRLYVLRRASVAMEATTVAQSQHIGAEMLASEMASGSAGIQALAGLAAIVLGILALAGNTADLTLNLVALLALGATLVLTGSTLSATVLNVMRT
jgi:hypothetical protein